jgi:hypothetical protein
MRKLNVSDRGNWIEMRRTILAELIAAKPSANWTSEKMAEEMRAHHIVKSVQPNYSVNSARRDWLTIRGELATKRIELADEYIARQLEVVDNQLERLLEEWDDVESIQKPDPIVLEDGTRIEMSDIEFANKKLMLYERLNKSIERLMARQAKLLPIEVPKKLEVRTETLSIDKLLQARANQQALARRSTVPDRKTIESNDHEIE